MKKKKGRTRIKVALQHKLNPLHIYCRLRPILGKRKALTLARAYESSYKKVLSGESGNALEVRVRFSRQFS